MVSIFKGDTAYNLIEIELDNPTNFEVYKVIVQCGEIQKVFIEPEWPLIVSLTKEETAKLDYDNFVYMAVENKNGDKLTPDGYGYFKAKLQVVEG